MTRHLKIALLATCLTALAPATPFASDAPRTPATAQPAPGTEPLSTGETKEQAAENGDSVAAIVNDTVITDYDLRQRIALVQATAGGRQAPEVTAQLRNQILEQLENERLQLLEAQKNNITVSAGDVDKAIESIMKENNLSQDKLDAMLSHFGVHMATLRAQIAAQIAWSKTVQSTYGDRADVTPQEINDEMERIAEGRNKPHYLVAEIFETVDNPEDDAKVKKNMDDLELQLRSGVPFPTLARQFSQNPTAAQGGDIGMVIDGQLPKELNAALEQMQAGMVSNPIRSAGGYYILYMRNREEGEGTKVAQADTPPVNEHPDQLPLARLLLPMPPKPSKDMVAKVMQVAGEIRDHIENCQMLPVLQKEIKGSVYMNLGTMRLAELSPEIQKALADTRGGETTEPFEDAAGVELITRCDKGAPPKTEVFAMPTRDDVEQQLGNQKLAVLERQYMRDLKRDADIEIPGDAKSKPRKIRADK
ncbi:MAG TPA: peptidylprolyl isomerase [Rhizomicrobium sp.]|jgi:peptidyl-prolyl cis-trans isomerase SurA|nr:peptidylprolyl isomerase [Rhizomicrobium sp.]